MKPPKPQLSRFSRSAKAGETLRPIAERYHDVLEELSSSGEVTRAARPKGDWMWCSRGLGLPAGAAQALLDELRLD